MTDRAKPTTTTTTKGANMATSSKKSKPTGFVVGKSYMIRTVTHHYTGQLIAIDLCGPGFLVLAHAAWIADSGARWADALRLGEFGEVEPYPTDVLVRINMSAVCDISDWNHPLPNEQK